MRVIVLALFLSAAWSVTVLAAAPADLPMLEQAWHTCLRDAYVHQPAGQRRAGNARNALDECKPHEDAYVAALMAVRPLDANQPVLAWTRMWTAYVVDPVRAWIEALRR